jgi:hypothetical protein
MASTDKDSFSVRHLGTAQGEVTYYVYAFNAACIATMFILNSMSIKHMMLSIGKNGAFIAGILNFIFNFAVSVLLPYQTVLDYLFDGKLMTTSKLFGAVLMILGFACIKGQSKPKTE